MTIQEFLEKFENTRKSGAGYTVRCPAHKDHENSLSVTEKDGKILLHCFAGCTAEAIAEAVGVEMKDLFNSQIPQKKKSGKAKTENPQKLVAEYIYTDEHGHPVAKKLRYEPKFFTWQRFESGEWKLGLAKTKPPLYRWPQIKDSSWALLVEGEKDADTAARLDLPGTTTGGVNTWTDAHVAALRGKKVVILADADEPGRINARKIAQSIWKVRQGQDETAELKLVELPGSKDLTEAVEKGTPKEVIFQLIKEAPNWKPQPASEVLDGVRDLIRRYIVLQGSELIAVTLWTAHTHAIAASNYTPYLSITSAERECGKTHLLKMLELFSKDPVRAANISPTALFRYIDLWHSTLLIDEMDAIGDKDAKEAIRGVLNAGYERGQYAIRNVGQGANMEPRKFDTFGAKALAQIGDTDDTVASRCIPIRLTRAKAGEIEDLDVEAMAAEAARLRAALAEWAERNSEKLKRTRPEMPKELRGRKAEICRPLLAIADLAGGDWPGLARAALPGIFSSEQKTSASIRVTLLDHIRQKFDEGHDFLATSELIEWLTSRDDWPWKEFGRAKKPITGPAIAKLLKPFGIKPEQRREDNGVIRGYSVAVFTEVFERFLS